MLADAGCAVKFTFRFSTVFNSDLTSLTGAVVTASSLEMRSRSIVVRRAVREKVGGSVQTAHSVTVTSPIGQDILGNPMVTG